MREPVYYTHILHEMYAFNNDILILYPFAFRDEKILQDNIKKMIKLVREYINETKKYKDCIQRVSEYIWDSQKTSIWNEAYEHKRKADKLAERMNEGISPYHWVVRGRFTGKIEGIHYNVSHVIRLEKLHGDNDE